MSGLKLHTSNRLENLAERLALLVRAPLQSVLQPEIVVVQSQGMARWLKLQLASLNGICSNCEFPFPRAFTYSVFRAADRRLLEKPAYDPGLLVWTLMARLPGLVRDPEFAALRAYLTGDTDGRKLYQISERIAGVFDQYLVFRPDMVLAWEAGKDVHWQARLWREISGTLGTHHPAALQAEFLERISQCSPVGQGIASTAIEEQAGSSSRRARSSVVSGTEEKAATLVVGLPERVSVFGMSALPPFYLDVLSALARHIEVNFFLLEPCREFWGYISSVREQERALKSAGKGAAQASTLHLETGNRLLASMGKLGRDFLMLIEDWAQSGQTAECFAEPGEATLLQCIQSDILNLRDRTPGGVPRKGVAADDDSIQVHSCHSALRELEVLQDHILDWFQKDPHLAPRDILVMIPEIERYAPLVHAVFGSPEDERWRIPFSVADRAPHTDSHLVVSFLAFLELAGSRLGASRVLALLESAPVRRKFKLAEADLELIRKWAEQVRIRWGQDEHQRAALGLPQWSENTWRHGLDRLLLGYAMAGGQNALFQDILPFADMEGDAVEVLGKLSDFVEKLFAMVKSLKVARPLDEWAAFFHGILRTFFETTDEDAAEIELLRSAFERMAAAKLTVSFTQSVQLAIVLEHLTRDLAEDQFGAGYLTGGVTFCALKPMRSIPAKVICLLGMNDAAFPRANSQLSFDLMAQQHRLGDRSSRQDDRYLFLETLLSARERLYLSYTGQSIRDNSAAPPSVLVSELLDYIREGFELPGKNIVEDLVFQKHRLQAFSPAYFRGGRLFSYSRQNLLASQTLSPDRKEPSPFIGQALAEPEEEWRRLALQSLADFFCNPARFLATKRLGLRLPSDEAALEEREAFALGGLERYQLQDELLDLKIQGGSISAAEALARAAGILPAGAAGSAHYLQAGFTAESFYQRLKRFQPEAIRPPMAHVIRVGEFEISATFGHVTPKGLLFFRPTEVKAKDLLRAWVEHLAWNAVPNRGGTTVVVGTKSVWTFPALPKPLPVLKSLLQLYWSGLCRPLRFFPESSLAFARAVQKKEAGSSRQTKQPIDYALASWAGTEFGAPGEGEDEYFHLFFKDERALGEDFQQHAVAVFTPLLVSAQEEPE